MLSQVLDALKIEIPQLITHIIGFLIALWILKRYAWKPLLALLDERRERIKNGFAEIENKRCQYLYKDADSGYFMDNKTYDQFTLPYDQIEGALQYIKDDTEVYVTFYENKPISVQPPIKVELKVIETPPGVKQAQESPNRFI